MCWQRCYVWIESRSKCVNFSHHYDDVTMTTIASQITSLMVVYLTVYLDADQRKHQSSVSLAFVWGIHRSPVNSPHKGPVTRKMFPFDDVIMGNWRVDRQTQTYSRCDKNLYNARRQHLRLVLKNWEFFQNVLFSNVIPYKCNISLWKWSNTIDI